MLKNLLIIGAAMVGATALAPTAAFAHDNVISFNGLTIGDKDKDLLDQLIELDADDIADIRDEMADAREDIRDAIADIDDARDEVKSVPGGKAILAVALRSASGAVSDATEDAFEEVRSELDSAERRLPGRASEIGDAEVAETQEAINALREGLDSVEAALAELKEAMEA